MADTTVSAKVGETFKIAIESNPTTGYEWKPSFDATKLRLKGAEHSAPKGIGASGTTVFVFEALSPGETQLRLTHKREWEAASIGERTYTVTVR